MTKIECYNKNKLEQVFNSIDAVCKWYKLSDVEVYSSLFKFTTRLIKDKYLFKFKNTLDDLQLKRSYIFFIILNCSSKQTDKIHKYLKTLDLDQLKRILYLSTKYNYICKLEHIKYFCNAIFADQNINDYI